MTSGDPRAPRGTTDSARTRTAWRSLTAALCAVACLTALPLPARAQRVENTPFAGFRVGSVISEVDGRPVVDDDGGPSVGVVVDVVFGPLLDGLKVEGVFSRQTADLEVRTSLLDPPASVRVEVDQIQAGGVHDFSDGRVRPFLAGLLGITRYAVPGDTEVRFSVGVGTGLKIYPTRHVGIRLDARGYMTVTDLGSAGVCGGFGCAIGFSVSPAFQGDFTAGLLVAF